MKDNTTWRSYELLVGADKTMHFSKKELENIIKKAIEKEMLEKHKTIDVNVSLCRTYNED